MYLQLFAIGIIHKGCPHIFATFQPLPSPFHACSLLLDNGGLPPPSLQTLTGRHIELQKLWKNKYLLKKTCILYLLLVRLFIFQSLTQEDDDKMTFKCPLLSYRPHGKGCPLTAKSPPSPCLHFFALVLTLPSPKVRTSFKDASKCNRKALKLNNLLLRTSKESLSTQIVKAFTLKS